MGNPKKPKSLHVLQGTFQNSRHAARDEIELPPGEPEKPDWLNPAASDEWDRIVPLLLQHGLISEVDGMAVASYCELVAEFKSTRACPGNFQAAKFAALRAATSDLGLNPIARTKIPGGKKEEGKKNPFSPAAMKNAGKKPKRNSAS